MTSKTMARKLNLSVKTIYKRLKQKGVFVDAYDYDYDNDVFQEICHEKYSLIRRKKLYETKQDLEIIHLFLTIKNNTTSDICKILNLPFATVSYSIDRFLKNKEIIIESKINEM